MGGKRKIYDATNPKAVTVYTVQSESSFIVVDNVPPIKVAAELEQRLSFFGRIQHVQRLPDNPAAPFTERYMVKYADISNARSVDAPVHCGPRRMLFNCQHLHRLCFSREAKNKMKDASFYGSLLHVRYGPEHESLDDVRLKMLARMQQVSQRQAL
ncbi:hypothetical protein BC831DRAFT_547652 [Entophlyctis helioformis]|nr:hypothetical protein BC831DRAFT_547652 [Entophlyctis helioformis]